MSCYQLGINGMQRGTEVLSSGLAIFMKNLNILSDDNASGRRDQTTKKKHLQPGIIYVTATLAL